MPMPRWGSPRAVGWQDLASAFSLSLSLSLSTGAEEGSSVQATLPVRERTPSVHWRKLSLALSPTLTLSQTEAMRV